jgi:hypothetical protein
MGFAGYVAICMHADKQQEKASRQANKHTRKKQKNNEESRTEKHN